MRHTLLGAVGTLALLTSGVSAADLPRKPQPAPVLAPMPVNNWTGCYIGGNVGGAWANIEVTDVTAGGATGSRNNSGFAGGGQIGCDYQMGPWVVGFRNMFDGTSLTGGRTISDPLFSGTVNSKTQWFDTLSARAGYLLQPNVLLYGQGGAAWTQTNLNFVSSNGSVFPTHAANKTGWTAGVGVEWMFVPRWSVFLEYNYMGFGTFSNAVTTCVGANCAVFSGKANMQDVLVGVNYKF